MRNQLATFSVPDVNILFARLTAVEKIDLRRASPDRIVFMAHNTYRTETGGSVDMVQTLQDLCNKSLADYDKIEAEFIPSTWKF